MTVALVKDNARMLEIDEFMWCWDNLNICGHVLRWRTWILGWRCRKWRGWWPSCRIPPRGWCCRGERAWRAPSGLWEASRWRRATSRSRTPLRRCQRWRQPPTRVHDWVPLGCWMRRPKTTSGIYLRRPECRWLPHCLNDLEKWRVYWWV